MLAAAHKTLEQECDLVVVDDAQLLDPLSATLVHQLAANGSARLVVTIRSGEPVPDAVDSLWKEGLLLTLHIDPFTGAQTGELARRVLGGVVAPRLVDELHGRSGGNLLLLRGLLSAGRENGVLIHTEDGWQLRGPLHPDRELYDLLEFRLRSLAPEELEAVELLAAGELLDWEVLRGLCDTDAAARLEQRGLIQLVADGSALVAQLNHPVIGETALRLAGVVRTRQLNGLLAQALRQHALEGRRSRLSDVRGQIRLAQLMMRSDLPPDQGERWCRLMNEGLLSAARAEPRLVPLATLPMQDGARAGAVLKEAMAAGFRGAMISTLPRGIGSVLDAPDLDPFWKAADDTGAVIHIHPAFDAGESRVHDYGLANGVGRVSDAVVAISRIAMSGHITRYRNAKVFVPIAAGGLPLVVGRLKRNHAITPGTSDPAEALSLMYTDTIEHDPRVLRFVIEMMGADRVMLGSDMPFPIGDHEPMTIVKNAGLKPDQVAAINGGTAAKLFRIQ